MSRVFITGASGLIGRRLMMEHVRRGDHVSVLSRKLGVSYPAGVSVIRGDLAIRGETIVFPDTVDVLYHCAAELQTPERMHTVNGDGTRRLAEAASGCVGRWIQLSSVGVYGPCRDGEVTEEADLAPANDYEVSKAAGDEAVLSAAARGAFQCAILRPSIVFGPGMPNRSLFQLAAMVRRGLFCHIGPPGASANYVPVENVVDALLLCAEHPAAAGRTYNLSDWATMEDFVAAVAAAVDAPVPRLRLPLAPMRALAALTGLIPGSPLTVARVDALSGRSRYPIRRIQEELGYRHRVSLPEALHATLTGVQSG